MTEETAGTPRTDDYYDEVPQWGQMVSADFARQLEREVAALTTQLDELTRRLADACSHANRSLVERTETAEAERDAAKRALAERDKRFGYERVRLEAQNNHLLNTLVAIHNFLPPPVMQVNDKWYRFEYPESMSPNDILHKLAEQIRAIPAALAAKSTEQKQHVHEAVPFDKPCEYPPAVMKVYAVCTGEVVEGRETYTLHDEPPPLCDYEVLLRRSENAG